jgi:hypothetical protein
MPPPPGDPGDFNADGSVDLADFNILASNFNLRFPISESFGKGDNNQDTLVNLQDFSEFREIFGAQQAPAGVPEPASTSLAGWALVTTLLIGRRRGRSSGWRAP